MPPATSSARRCSTPREGAPGALAERVERLYEVRELQADLRERALFERLDVLARIQESIAHLQESEAPEELIDAAPRELCRSCGFTRALISRVEGSRWIPEVIETVPGMDPEEARFAEYIAGAEILLEHMLLETELVRRRMPALVTDPLNDPRTYKDIVTRGRTVAYVAAPIMPAGRVIGFLHADRIGQDHPVSAEDRDNLWAFAEQFGLIYERAVLMERLRAQRAQLRAAFTDAEGVVEELWNTEIEFARAGPRDAGRDAHRGGPVPALGVAPRQPADAARARGARAHDQRSHEHPHRRAARALRGHRQVACQAHPAQAPRRQPRGGGRALPADRDARPGERAEMSATRETGPHARPCPASAISSAA